MVEICPRCGLPGYLKTAKRGNRVYFYVEHRFRLAGRVKYKTCYIGPVDQYKYVEKFHVLSLTNFPEQDYLIVAKEAIRRFVEKKIAEASIQEDVEKKQLILRETRKLLERFLNYVNEKIKEVVREAEITSHSSFSQ